MLKYTILPAAAAAAFLMMGAGGAMALTQADCEALGNPHPTQAWYYKLEVIEEVIEVTTEDERFTSGGSSGKGTVNGFVDSTTTTTTKTTVQCSLFNHNNHATGQSELGSTTEEVETTTISSKFCGAGKDPATGVNYPACS